MTDKENGPKSINDLKLINTGKILENNKTLVESRSPVSEIREAPSLCLLEVCFLFGKTILFILRVFKFIMTMFFHYCIVFLLSDEPYRPEVEPTRIFFMFVHMILEHLTK
ncbi:putative Ubiquitin-like domain superfamily, UBL3-like, ubiquitin domain-containing protein [Helianthus annuus]|nr:putative Ubiquitin-like domain superfamily, UBL3-like, ubiquitin domain-containing protein [Helianthus annuus]